MILSKGKLVSPPISTRHFSLSFCLKRHGTGIWAQQQGAAVGLSRLCWYAKRSGEMARITKRIIGTSRELTVVAGTQASRVDIKPRSS